ncbi:MAG: glycosyltransferase [Parachlamydiaceae bacterium]|nr:glycosyltransferase [Parachlamydiaceae bacterium]
MIVKNESAVITRCLTSVLPIIDYWVVVDTGSSDKTPKIIKEFMEKNKIPGELHERPWINFGHNRDEALKLAKDKGDYIFFIDADNTFEYEPEFKLENLDKDFYYVTLSDAGTRYVRIALIKNSLNWEWVGVLHEAVCCPVAKTYSTLEKVTQLVRMDGSRSKDPKKYEKDAAVFEEALQKEPNNARYVFYLAQSYFDAKNYPMALKNYEKRVAMGGFDQEVFCSLLRIGKLQEKLKMSSEHLITTYNKAFQYRKTRVEPLYYLANIYREREDFNKSYLICKIAETIPPSQDTLFVEQWIYDYGMPLELSIAAYWTERYEESQKISQELLKKDLPDHVRPIVENNLGFANGKLLEKALE